MTREKRTSMRTRKKATPPRLSKKPIAISYIRFSFPLQKLGDSLRRQMEAAEAWCQRNGIPLDQTLALRDLGVSAFRGRQRSDKSALGGFLKLVEAGKVPRGSFLIIENLDRLSREEERTALRLWLDILDHGVNIVQLQPEVVFRHERSDYMDIIRAILELGRGHSESQMKSERAAAFRSNQLHQARVHHRRILQRLPAWLEEKDGQWHVVAEKAAAIRRVFALAAEGHLHTQIVKQLNQESVPAIGHSGRWLRGYVWALLTDRRVLGELQPRRRGGHKKGCPLVGYYPAIVTPQEFYLAWAGCGRRQNKLPRVALNVAHLFAGLLCNGRTGGRLQCREALWQGKRYRILFTPATTKPRSSTVSFPSAILEHALLSQLVEVNPGDFTSATMMTDPAALEEQLTQLRSQQTEMEARLVRGGAAALGSAYQDLEKGVEDLLQQLEDARERATKPLVVSWQEVKTLAGCVLNGGASQGVWLRLQSALRRVLAEIWLVLVPRGRDRLCEAQVWVAGGQAFRSYTILYRRCFVERPGAWVVVSGDHPDSGATGLPCPTKDLRDPKQAEAVYRRLKQLPRKVVSQLLRTGQVIPCLPPHAVAPRCDLAPEDSGSAADIPALPTVPNGDTEVADPACPMPVLGPSAQETTRAEESSSQDVPE